MSRDLDGLRAIGAVPTVRVRPSAPAPARAPARSSLQVPHATVAPARAPLPKVAPARSSLRVPPATSKKSSGSSAQAKARAQQAQGEAKRAAQRLRASAGKLARRFPKQAGKLGQAAASIEKRAARAATQIHGDGIGGLLGISMVTADALAYWQTYVASANAVSLLGDVISQVQPYVDQLKGAGQYNLATVGENIVARAQDVINNYDPEADPPDTTVSSTVPAIQSDASTFVQQAQAALHDSTAVTPPDAASAAATDGGAAPSDGGASGGSDAASSDGGGFDGGSGGSGGSDAASSDGGGFDGGDGGDGGDAGGGGGGGGGGDGEDTEPAVDETTQEDEEETDVDATIDDNDPFADVVSTLVGAPVIPKAGQEYTDHDTVLAVQKALKARGFDPGPLDGVMGPKTARAIRLMQMAAGVPETGVIDEGVLAALAVAAPRGTVSPGTAPATPAPTSAMVLMKESFLDYLRKPVYTGSSFKIWHVGVGAGVALALSAILLSTVRRK